jgi:hypothetical protein
MQIEPVAETVADSPHPITDDAELFLKFLQIPIVTH